MVSPRPTDIRSKGTRPKALTPVEKKNDSKMIKIASKISNFHSKPHRNCVSTKLNYSSKNSYWKVIPRSRLCTSSNSSTLSSKWITEPRRMYLLTQFPKLCANSLVKRIETLHFIEFCNQIRIYFKLHIFSKIKTSQMPQPQLRRLQPWRSAPLALSTEFGILSNYIVYNSKNFYNLIFCQFILNFHFLLLTS